MTGKKKQMWGVEDCDYLQINVMTSLYSHG